MVAITVFIGRGNHFSFVLTVINLLIGTSILFWIMSGELGETSVGETTESSDSNTNINIKDFFVKFNDISSRCKICCNVLKHHNNTTNLRNHLKRKHPDYISSCNRSQKRLCLSKTSTSTNPDNSDNQKSTKEKSSDSSSLASTITWRSSTSTSTSTKLKSVDQAFREIDSFSESGGMHAKITNALLFMIATDNLPLWTVEQKGFLFFMKTIAPHYKVPGRTTITRRLDEKYYVLSKKLIDEFSSTENFTVTTDIWTDTLNTRGFLGVTVHYLGLDSKMNSVALGAYPLDQSHTHQYIGCVKSRERPLSYVDRRHSGTPEKCLKNSISSYFCNTSIQKLYI